ncbi:MAG: NAD(P)/FAD-dependent oxidoreductase [Reichenbachiella sp.]
MLDVVVIGGGLSGLLNAILLARAGWSVRLYEQKTYPFHRVCGEYISNEVKQYLTKKGLFPSQFEPANISKLVLSSASGQIAESPLAMGGFGISRYALDQYWVEQARAIGVEVLEKAKVTRVTFKDNAFEIQTNKDQCQSRFVIGAYGKRSTLDTNMHREFMSNRSPYLGVKYHIKIDRPSDTIALHNFHNGYCGMSEVEGGVFNLCYLSHRSNMKGQTDLPSMEAKVLQQNPLLKSVWEEAEFLFDTPMVINEVSFAPKQLVEDHVLMCGDAAGMITPLCGNGMAMAIRSADMLSSLLIEFGKNDKLNREVLEEQYTKTWQKEFALRLRIGRNFQKLFGGKWNSEMAVRLMRNQTFANWAIGLTHGSEMMSNK